MEKLSFSALRGRGNRQVVLAATPCPTFELQAELEKDVAYHVAVDSEEEEWID